MTPLRPPVVAGFASGIGTSTVAAALHGIDGGVAAGPGADVLVCPADPVRLRRLAVLLPPSRPGGAGPVLAVAHVHTVAARAALGEVAGRFAHVVGVPHVPSLHGQQMPPWQLATLMGTDRGTLDGPLRGYADALGEVAAALVSGGRLGAVSPAPAPPPAAPATRPVGPVRRLWPGLGPVERERPAPLAVLDDDMDDLDLVQDLDAVDDAPVGGVVATGPTLRAAG
ncbi:MAG: hypothetical protein ACT4RN_15610 [Pseudonocardia sp.]